MGEKIIRGCQMFYCSLGTCVILEQTEENIILKTGVQFVVGSFPVICKGFLSWHWGHYYSDLKTAVSVYNEAVSRETP